MNENPHYDHLPPAIAPEPVVMSLQKPLDPDAEARFLWVQIETVLRAHPSHRPAHANSSLVRMYHRLEELTALPWQ